MAGDDVPDTHPAFRERVLKLLGQGGHVQFEPSLDPTLIAFSALFASSGLSGFAANKQLRLDALTLVYDCWTESTRQPGEQAQTFAVAWTPNRQGMDPLTGFRTGEDSILLGTAPPVAMPQDERTDALLLLVTSRFVHLSARRATPADVIHGVLETSGASYRFLTLQPGVVIVDEGAH
jgi:hypothetical protein